ncbi:hypothetical protein [Sphingomonas sp. Leaf343]|uniref:hypothetical protein n=1 Tax=Sphingomonas sp. Leaf343 TaxID=1736345 RepID=UPI0007022D56|nr:hypothetical protein [Sphingomonas sp. Leaf343]KQR84231.1 hypothetical protein ASG07_06500 [Sphingomonas sp. Leaf343]
MFSIALLAAVTMPNATIMGDFDRDGRMDRVRLERKGEAYNIVMYRATGDVEPVQRGVTPVENFKFKKVSREARGAACQAASVSRYVCDAGDVLEYGTASDYVIAIWNGSRFVLHRPLSPQTAAS